MLFTYLALGDSYTIGEQVPVYESFPYQAVQLFRKKGLRFTAPEIIAKTGWTTDELIEGINRTELLAEYNLVTLLVGVNNQYRGRDINQFSGQFELLLKQALVFSGNMSANIFVFSIPDWGITPFADGRDKLQISKEIDEFNQVCRYHAEKHHVSFIDITDSQRTDGKLDEFLAADKLHPSGKEYSKWAALLSERFGNEK